MLFVKRFPADGGRKEDEMASPARQIRVEDPRQALVLLHPVRSAILAELRRPRSATEVARALGQPAPRVNHHFRRLRDARLIRRAGSRRVRNLVEVLYVAIGRTFVVAEGLTPGAPARGALRAEEGHRPLRNLIALGERLQGDSLALLDEAAHDGREFSTYATAVGLRFPDANSRAAFLGDLLAAVKGLRERYGAELAEAGSGGDGGDGGATDGEEDTRYTTIVACYPERRRV
jgi:DNA-binding transcriptional ArsR family regulator